MADQGTTDELCARDAYARAMDAVVVAVVEGPDGGPAVVLDRTVFYARGGGQPGDTGRLRWEGGDCVVVDTVRVDGEPAHVLEGRGPTVGGAVHGEIDWGRRHVLMRTHTALHALSGVIWSGWGAKVTGGNIDVGGIARMDFELETITAEFGAVVEKRLNDALADDHAVEVSFLPRAEALADPDLVRTKVSLIPDAVDPIRVVDIVGLDRQADGGTHVGSTREVGTVRVLKTENKGKAFRRIRIELT